MIDKDKLLLTIWRISEEMEKTYKNEIDPLKKEFYKGSLGTIILLGESVLDGMFDIEGGDDNANKNENTMGAGEDSSNPG